ncbi:Ppx/GppA family phosphatase [candidate division KSB1 bacterium]|nr:Ppx/GppA family phosphatase [candidate division KSB1 bacterium]
MTRKAAIDIGTNSTRLLIAEVAETDEIAPLHTQERLTRLGDKSTPESGLDAHAMERVLLALQEYQEICSDHGVAEPVVFATSATREARNGRELVDKIAAQTGWRCRVISGQEEALLSFKGVISDRLFLDSGLVCDIGGGSTELIFVSGRSIRERKSLLLGSRRLTTLYLAQEPVSEEQIQAVRDHTERLFRTLPSVDVRSAVGVGGTATTLALMAQQTPLSRAQSAHGYCLSRSVLDDWIVRLADLSVAERKGITGLHPERADVILAGALILELILDFYRLESVQISIRDLLYGAILPGSIFE